MKNNPQLGSPNPLVENYSGRVIDNHDCLDLGCGLGVNSLYLAQRGFRVTAVDQNARCLSALQQKAKKAGLENQIRIVQRNLAIKTIPRGKYSVVLAIDFLHFLQPKRCEKIVKIIKARTAQGGVVIAKAFLQTGTPLSPKQQRWLKLFSQKAIDLLERKKFQRNELRDWFDDFDVIHYREFTVDASGKEDPLEVQHYGVAEIVAVKS